MELNDSDITEAHAVAALLTQVKELQQGVRGASVTQVVGAVYKNDPRMKDFIKETLGCTAIELMARTPRQFAISRDKCVVLPADSGAAITMEEVAKHCTKEDGWIVVKGEVYDITEFIRTHWGWHAAGKNSTIIAIMSALGGDCTRDFDEVHRAQLEGFRVGVVSGEQADEGERVAYQTWDQLVESGRIPKGCMPTQNAGGKWTLPVMPPAKR